MRRLAGISLAVAIVALALLLGAARPAGASEQLEIERPRQQPPAEETVEKEPAEEEIPDPGAEEAPAAPRGAESGAPGAAAPVAGVDPGELFVNANRVYEAGDYRAAVDGYRGLLEGGFDGARLHYNLGNAYLRNGELGRAVASYRRSLERAPRDEDARANLAFARRSAKDALAPPEPSPLLATLFFWHYGLGRGELLGALLVVNLAFWAVAAARIRYRRSEVLRWTFFLLLLLLLALAGSVAAHLAFPTRVAVVIPQEVEARTAPDPEAVVRFKLHAGTEVRLRDRRDGWLRISLPDGQQGWLQETWAEVTR